MKEAWVLRLKDASKDSYMKGDYYFTEYDISGWLTNDLNNAAVYENKDEEIGRMKKYEEILRKQYGENAIANFGYTNMMLHFEFVEVTVEKHAG